jgi:transglutaminase-like putative cysteine protease
VPPVLPFAAALVYVAGQGGTYWPAASALLGLLLIVALLRAGTLSVGATGREYLPGTTVPARGGGSARNLARGLPLVLLLAAVGTGTGIAATAVHAPRADPRGLSTGPLDLHQELTPLATIRSQLQEGQPRVLFTVRFTAGTPVALMRTAALDAYDGALWTESGQFRLAGHVLPADTGMDAGPTVTASVTIRDLDGQFLPAAGWPVQVDPTGSATIGFDSAAGVLASPDSTVAGLTYVETGDVPAASGLSGAVVSTAPGYARYVTLPPGLPPVLPGLARQITHDANTPYDRLSALTSFLRALPYDLDARPGHSYAVVDRMLTGTGPGDSHGYAEQHASAFAVLARVLGYPTRVAVGYKVDPPTAPGRAVDVTTRDAHAWDEVHFDGLGWVAFDPTDPGTTDHQLQQRPTVNQQNGPVQPTPAATGPAGTSNSGGNGTAGGLSVKAVVQGTAIGAVVLLIVLVLLYVFGVLGAKARRRWRRRHRGTTSERVVGAWLELRDRLIERGTAISPKWTPTQLALATGGSEELLALADLVTTALFGPLGMSSDQVRAAWRAEAVVRRQWFPRRFQRWVNALNPRPLYKRPLGTVRSSRARSRRLRGQLT